ncbi:MAG: hypothetical protein PHX05_10385 [Acidobacteriota bacterium]|nr:hypothetical protein [Acidobacteriota bacterium]
MSAEPNPTKPKIKTPRPVRPWRRAASALLDSLARAWPWMRKATAARQRLSLRDEYEKRLAGRNEALEKQALELVRLQQVIDQHLHPLLELDRLHQDRTQLIIRCAFSASFAARLIEISRERLGKLSPARQVGLDWYTASAARKYMRFLKQVLEAPASGGSGAVEEIPVLNVDDKNEK